MLFLAVHSLGLFNLWIFMFIFAVPILVTIYFRRHIFQASSSRFRNSRRQRSFRIFIAAKFYMLFYFIYSIFIPIQLNSAITGVGLFLYLAGFITYTSSWIVIASSQEGTIFKKGPFRFSRHPVYLSSAIMFLGTGLMSNSFLFLGLSILTGLSHMHNAYEEEKICIEIFGDQYRDYIKQTSRWIGLPTRV